MKCGLLGRKLGHSYSPQIHSYLGSYSYTLFEKEPEALEGFLKSGDFTGINVTMPYKKDVIPYCDNLSDCAKKLGAVNVLVRRNGKLIGHNTDYFGFQSMIARSGMCVDGKKALVLGTGGASATAVAALNELGANVVIVSRTGENNYSNLHLHADAAFIVNATPVGMYPNTGVSPVDLSLFPKLEYVYDIVYNPARTQLLLDAEKRNIPCMNGLWMLVAQAKEASEWFTDSKIDDSAISRIFNLLAKQTENIVLIGMPGCGKSTIGKLLGEYLGKTFVDADSEIEKLAGMSIPEIFAKYGEAGFRKLETQILGSLGSASGQVIATGGGCVTKEENYDLLHQNGSIWWIQRELDALPTDGRPLSQATGLEEMYRIREPMYHRFADHIIENNRTLDEIVAQIREEYRK